MWKYTEIDQYQLIQEDAKRYRFKINASQKFNREQELKEEFIGYLGGDAVFEIEKVDEIPLLASGKRRKVVNNFIKIKPTTL
jgi:phenylacetate-CoA ligase